MSNPQDLGAAAPVDPTPDASADPFAVDPTRTVEPPPAPSTPPALDKEGILSQFDTVKGILEALVPPEGDIVMTDTAGNKYKLRRSIPGAVETRILRKIEALANLSADVAGPEFADRFRAVISGGAPKTVLMNVVRLLAGSDVLLGALSECAKMAHPQVLIAARRASAEDETSCAMLESLGVTAETAELHHMFDVVELVSSLLPFVLANTQKLMGLATSMLRAS